MEHICILYYYRYFVITAKTSYENLILHFQTILQSNKNVIIHTNN